MSTRMPSSRMLTTLLVILVAVCCHAQDSYREALKEYLPFTDQFNQMKSFYQEQCKVFFKPSDNVNLEDLAQRYIQEACLDDLAYIFIEPMMKECGITEADLRTVKALASSPEGQIYVSHNSEWSRIFNSKVQELSPWIQNDEELKPVQADPNIDAEYAAKFKSVMEASGFKQKTVNLMDEIFNSYQNVLSNEPDEADGIKLKIDNIKNWIDDNIETVALNSAFGVLTPDDLDYALKSYSNESFKKVADMGIGMMSQFTDFSKLLNLGYSMIKKYLDWMESHGAQLSEQGLLSRFYMNNDINEEPMIKD